MPKFAESLSFLLEFWVNSLSFEFFHPWVFLARSKKKPAIIKQEFRIFLRLNHSVWVDGSIYAIDFQKKSLLWLLKPKRRPKSHKKLPFEEAFMTYYICFPQWVVFLRETSSLLRKLFDALHINSAKKSFFCFYTASSRKSSWFPRKKSGLHALWYIRVWNIRVSTQKLKINKGHECLIWKF